MEMTVLLVLCVLSFIVVLGTDAGVAAAADLNEYQKQTVEAIREITLQLILIAMGIFAIVGGFVAGKDRPTSCRPLLWIAFVLLGLSVVAGLLTYGNLIWALGKGRFEAFGMLEPLASGQWITFGLGGLVFGLFVLVNLRK